jgi:iron(III) transport system ATP-binding protein
MSGVRMVNIKKWYGKTLASDIQNLEINEGEVMSFLGPSGCGKTTALRIIAGLTKQNEGDVYIGDRLVNDVPVEKRNTSMVFQSYALFPHMSVFDNVAFGLRIRKLQKEEIRSKVASVLEMVKLSGMDKRLPTELSGGQQQRIALARAVVTDPEVLLFDEPLSNLDAKLREYMRFELRSFLKELKITSIYVTHDQAEALVLSDRVAVIDKGSVQQIDLPHNIYRKPKSEFVADFMGTTSFIKGHIEKKDERRDLVAVKTDDGLIFWAKSDGISLGDHVLFCVRPESVEVFKPGERTGENVITGTVETFADMGEYLDYHVRIGKNLIRAKTFFRADVFCKYERIGIWLDPNTCFTIKEGR